MRIAVLDMNDGTKNLGIPSILNLIAKYPELVPTVYDVRGKCELPDLSYDMYILSGGPGSPLEGDGLWDRAFYFFLDKLWKHNQREEHKKYALFICHSFQMACHHLSVGDVMRRPVPSLGVIPVELTEAGERERIFDGLNKTVYVGDFRHWHVINPNRERLARLGGAVLASEFPHEDENAERAIMAIKFSPEWIGTQFHPEADPDGMIRHFHSPNEREQIIEKNGKEAYDEMLEYAQDPQKLRLTFEHIIPNFIEQSINKIESIHAVNTL